ncbi:MAG: DUF2207 domain-containing protein [Dokdonella sp.]
MKRLLRGLCLIFALIAASATADERILAFHSDIVVNADASMQVTEMIRVRSEANQIRHGIYRDFPTDYRDRYGNRVHVDFEAQALTRDGRDEPFHSEAQSNGVRVYFGSSDMTLDRGEYTYRFQYRTTRQLGFFADHDELYWNATGNGWDFPIDVASADVTLPGAIAQDDLHVEAYTGPQGDKGKAYSASVDAPSHVSFSATATLPPRSGLTIVVSFPKGQVEAPTHAARANWFVHDNGGVIIGAGGLLLAWLYYLVQWFRVGRDPKPGVIIPQYEAPPGFSPGTLRHIEKMGYDDRCFAADIVDLAVHGKLRIEQADKNYSLHRASGGKGAAIPDAEATLLDAALGSSDVLELKQENHTRIASARAAHSALLDKNNNTRYFRKNSGLVIPGVVLCLGALLLGMRSLTMGSMAPAGFFMLIWLSVWSMGVISLLGGAIKAWRTSTGIAGYGGALFLTLFSLPFVAGEIFGLGIFIAAVGAGFAIMVVALIATNVAFFDWLKAPTLEGRELLDKIAGLRLYLGVAERDELAAQKAPSMTTDEFQHFLPYALALDVEKTWADRFANAVGPAAAAAAASSVGWYQGNTGMTNLGSFTSNLGSSLSSAISSSSSAPGSSPAVGGGGSSGGGGGGGGGGGW